MLDNVLKFGAIGSLIISALAIYFAVRSNTFQLGAHIFLSYSDRVWTIRKAAIFETKDSEAVAAAIFLVFELFELKRRGYVSRSIWTIWDNDIADLFGNDAFREQWITIRPRLKNHPHFLQWVDSQVDPERQAPKSWPGVGGSLRLREPRWAPFARSHSAIEGVNDAQGDEPASRTNSIKSSDGSNA
jgi:hypothetical protein